MRSVKPIVCMVSRTTPFVFICPQCFETKVRIPHPELLGYYRVRKTAPGPVSIGVPPPRCAYCNHRFAECSSCNRYRQAGAIECGICREAVF